MAPRSPSHAFDPTPALEYNKDNYSPLNDPFVMSPTTSHDDQTSKEVRFTEPTIIPPLGRHSIATTNVPLLPQIPSASQVPKQSFRMTNSASEIDITAYIENCRNLNEQMRQTHDTERRSWEIERTALKARIADLEFQLNKSRDSKRRLSNDSSTTNTPIVRSNFPVLHNTSPSHALRTSSESVVSGVSKNWKISDSYQPVWKGPESTPPATRVFSNEDDINHLPSISEDEPLSTLSREISPTSMPVGRANSVSVPVTQVDNTLDGITLKSSGLTSSFVARLSSPPVGSPGHSPSPKPKNGIDRNGTGNLQVKMADLLSISDERLKRDAGHTPMAFDGTLSTENASTAVATPRKETPPAPAPSTRPPARPSERSDSYFSFVSQGQSEGETQDEPVPNGHEYEDVEDEDPSLEGPLILDPHAKSEAAQSFLDKVDAKLMEAAESDHHEDEGDNKNMPNGYHHHDGHDTEESTDNVLSNERKEEEEMPMLKIRNSSNFGSAWGGDKPGNI